MLGWGRVRRRDLANIRQARRFAGADRVTQMYEWQTARLTMVAKGIAATVVTFLTTALFAFLKKEIKQEIEPWQVILAAGVLASASLYACLNAWRLTRLPREYAESLRILESLASLDPEFPQAPWS